MKKQTSFAKTGLLLAVAAGLTLNASAQSYPYNINFEAPENGAAPVKTYANMDTFDLNGISWILPGVYLGAMLANDKYNDEHAVRMRLTGNTTGAPGYMMMVSDLPDGVGTITLNAAMYGAETSGALGVYYSTDAGASWIQASATVNPGATLTAYTFTVEQAGNVRIRIQKEGTNNVRINIDDIEMSSFGPASLAVISKAPAGADIPITTSSLSITFSEAIAAGMGDFSLTRLGGSTMNYPVADAEINGETAIINGIVLENAAQYYIELPAGAFTNIAGDLISPAISGSTSWAFSTPDTTTPTVTVLTELEETFDVCDNNNLMGVFTHYSVSGDKKWRCSNLGHNDAGAVYINGGSAAGLSEANTDYLITSGPLDISATEHPELSFWQIRRFNGNVTRDVLVCTDYTPGSNPTEANWQSVYTFSDMPDTVWTPVSEIDLSAYRNTPFYLAFTYTCVTDGAYELTYDDIKISAGNVGIRNHSQNDSGIRVLGAATPNNILLQVSTAKAANATFSIYDMQGRRVYNHIHALNSGSNIIAINDCNLNAGIYIIRVSPGAGSGTVKVKVQ